MSRWGPVSVVAGVKGQLVWSNSGLTYPEEDERQGRLCHFKYERQETRASPPPHTHTRTIISLGLNNHHRQSSPFFFQHLTEYVCVEMPPATSH